MTLDDINAHHYRLGTSGIEMDRKRARDQIAISPTSLSEVFGTCILPDQGRWQHNNLPEQVEAFHVGKMKI